MPSQFKDSAFREPKTEIGHVHDKGQQINQQSAKPPSKLYNALWSVIVLCVGVALIIGFFHWDKNGQISRYIQSFGSFSIVLSIAFMMLFCIIPVPSEFLIILNMKVFHVWWGILYSWLGSMLGSVAVFLLARYFVRNLFSSFITEKQMSQVEKWVGRRGAIGLILARIIPLPFIVVNYTAGIVRSVTLWRFIWTSAVGGIPYYTGAALLFLGVSKKYLIWLIVGGCAVGAIWLGGVLYNKYSNLLSRWTH